MLLNKFLQGGRSSIPAFVNYTPVIISDSKERATADTSSASSKDDSGITSKELMQMIKTELDGLPIDVQKVAAYAKNFELDLKLGISDTSSLESVYLNILALAKNAKFNKEQFEKAQERIMQTGGINEVAIDDQGNVLCKLGEDFKKLTPLLYILAKKLYPEIHALTNQELLELRQSRPELALDTKVLQMVQNGIGMEAINKLINDSVRSLGSDELKREGYTLTEQLQIKQGLEYLQKAQDLLGEEGLDLNTSIDGMYNMGVMTKDQANQALMALQYIAATLPKNARALLDIKAEEAGLSSGLDIIQQLIGSRISRVNTQDLSRSKASASKDGSTSASTEQAIIDKMKLSPVMMAQLGKTSTMPIKVLNGTKYQMTIQALVVPIVSTSGSPLGAGVSLQDVSTSQYAGALDFNNASIGGQAIDPSALDKVIVDSTNLYIMNLPYTYTSDGTIIPDLKWLKTIESIDITIREKGITDINEINKMYQDAGLPVLMDAQGNLNTTNYCKFGVLNGKAASNTFLSEEDLDIAAREINDDNLIGNYVNAVNKGRDKDSKVGFDKASLWDRISPFWNDHDTLYEGTIYMPFRDDILNGALSSNQELTAELASIIQARNQLRQRLAAVGGYHPAGLEL